MNQVKSSFAAFAHHEMVASGDLHSVANVVKKLLDGGERRRILLFDDSTGRQVEIDFRGTPADVQARLEADGRGGGQPTASPDSGQVRRGPGRPRLGVVGREVTLLPRHWDWLNAQPGGASVALRKLVERARRTQAGEDRIRLARESAFRFMQAMAGDEVGFEEATRSLFRGDYAGLLSHTGTWPRDILAYALQLAAAAFPPSE